MLEALIQIDFDSKKKHQIYLSTKVERKQSYTAFIVDTQTHIVLNIYLKMAKHALLDFKNGWINMIVNIDDDE